MPSAVVAAVIVSEDMAAAAAAAAAVGIVGIGWERRASAMGNAADHIALINLIVLIIETKRAFGLVV